MLTVRSMLPLILVLIAWYLWSVKQKFVSKEEFLLYKEYSQKGNKILEAKISKQMENMREIKTDIKHMAESLKDIKEFILNIKK